MLLPSLGPPLNQAGLLLSPYQAPRHCAEVAGDHQRDQPVYFKLWCISGSLKSSCYLTEATAGPWGLLTPARHEPDPHRRATSASLAEQTCYVSSPAQFSCSWPSVWGFSWVISVISFLRNILIPAAPAEHHPAAVPPQVQGERRASGHQQGLLILLHHHEFGEALLEIPVFYQDPRNLPLLLAPKEGC